ncbi:ParB N-terminal domain-containing protein [Vibrio mediterranei]|uniref:Chromosome partitioning protein ParB n=1 Tax=Vibrio mediterranei TaxID=689 RepID=A0A3G4VJJ3_9VIBR|nr:ParB/RepB/Spo0J family partition protein [Vibrio mediterranei]AYV24977.1 chromosome partitioning protein ParB [Vibrio mediterranei]MCG9790758.1 ParB N-terminal domain-containing protein [Vibrio mediterranei]
MNAKTQAQTLSVQETTTNVSTLDSQATAQNDISLQRLPIRVLVVSELNVRKTKTTKEQDAELKASIAAHGLIQNLVALPEDNGVYGVVAGGRRLTQLKALVNDGLLSLDDIVPVKVLTDSEAKDYAQQMSLTENLTRAAMHPADEFEAFSDMIDKGATVEAVAQHFGKTQTYVHQRMKLAAVIPAVLDAYREGEVGLDRVMVFTIASPERQAEVWEQVKESRWYNDNQIRNMLKETAIESTHLLAKFVGQEAYEQAGGAVTSDLFSEKVYFEDRALMESLATQKIEVEAEKLRAQGWKWTEIVLQRTYDEAKGYKELVANKGQYKKAEKALAGCILSLGYDNQIHVTKGLVAKADRKALKKLQTEKAKQAKGADNNDSATEEAGGNGVSTEASYSAALTEDLKAHRLIMGKHALMMQSALAVDVLHFTLCVKAFVLHSSTPADISLNQSHDEPKQGDFSENKALERIAVHKESLDLLWLEPKSNQERFEAFQKLDEAEKQKQLAFATALTLKKSLAQENQPYGFEFLYQLLDFDAADYWRPTTDSFLKRIDKDALIDIARPVMSEEWLKAAESLKKADLVKQLEVWLSGGDDALTDAQKAHFAKWMPQGF